jgi:hypothetical protein
MPTARIIAGAARSQRGELHKKWFSAKKGTLHAIPMT